MIRTRAIISRLSYDALVTQDIIPNMIPLLSDSVMVVKRYPPFVYANKDFSFFGMLLDYIIRATLRTKLNQKIDLGKDPILDILPKLPDTQMLELMSQLSIYETSTNINDIAKAALSLITAMYNTPAYTPEQIQGYIGTLVNMTKEISDKWAYFATYLNGTIKYNVEYSHKNFSGHPDIVTDRCILDIKTTASFNKMAKESLLQVLAYYALAKASFPNMQYIGFLLPMQRDIAIYDISAWNHTKYLNLLVAESLKIQEEENPNTMIVKMLTQMVAQPTPTYNIGTHISKGKNIAVSLREWATKCPGLPCQMFLGSPRNGKRSAATAGQIPQAKEVISQYKLLFFTHSAYIINLCANECDNGDYWQQRYLNEDLIATAAMGGQGVVVHTGARKDKSEAEALNIMEYMVRTALVHATESCKLLLETPCKEDTEVCGNIEDLANFFFRFTIEERKKLGVTIDTCHVTAAGYDPLAYLQHWEQHAQTPICLVHYNDSQGACGSCVDRHAPPGTGCIGMEKMNAIAAWCHARNIPMVLE